MRYIAFISFRHVDPDQRWAKWLHTRLEGYRIPKALLKGRADNRVGRVFRDAEELAACADLPHELKAALADSEYLIIICSPETAGSRWVNQEIREFAALGRTGNILALLVRGEPDDAFPPVLQELGIEPLAADVRDGNRHTRQDAELRLLARLIGCRFDDLRQREHERRLRQALLLTGIMTVAAAAFCVVAIIALIQRDTARSRELAVNSSYVVDDDPELAVLLATEALHLRGTDEAEEALRQGLARDLIRRVIRAGAGRLVRVAFTADARRLVTGSERGMLQLWNPDTGALLFSVHAHAKAIDSVAFSPDSQLLVTASSEDPTARIWNAASGAPIRDLVGHTGGVTHAEFSHDGKSVVTSSEDKTARVWSVESGEVTAVLAGHSRAITAAAFSVDDKFAFTASRDRYAHKWDLRTGRPVAQHEHDGEVFSLAVSPDGRWVATGVRGFAYVLDTVHLNPGCELIGHDDDHEVIGVRFSADGHSVATAGTDGEALVANVQFARTGGECPTVKLTGHNGSVNAVAFSSDGRSVMTASADDSARIWDAGTGQLLSKLLGHTGPLTDLAVSSDGRYAATASADGSTRIWQAELAIPRLALEGEKSAASPRGTRVLTWTDRAAALWDSADGHEVAKLEGQVGGINDALFSGDGAMLLTADAGGTVRLWDAATAKRLREFHADANPLSHVALSRDGRLMAVSSNTGLVRIWDLGTAQPVAELHGHTAPVNSLMFSHDGRRLLTASDDRTARIWDASNGASLLVYRGHTGPVRRATFTADGARVVSAGPGNGNVTSRDWNGDPVHIWDAGSGTDTLLLSGHTDYIHDAMLSPNGKWVVSASEDRSAAVWDAGTGIRISTLSGHQAGVNQAVFSADSRFVATPGGDCALRVWEARSGRVVLEFGESLGCFADAEFGADGTTLIARSVGAIKGFPAKSGIAVLTCELCTDSKHLLALAHSRLTRGLSAAEKARFLR